MISLSSIPSRIKSGESLKICLDIQGPVNLSTYKNSYFNLTIKKNGGNLGTVNAYPLRWIGESIEWEINQYTYGLDNSDLSGGTFNVVCSLQSAQSGLKGLGSKNSTGPKIPSQTIGTCTFIVESVFDLTDQSKNITAILQQKNSLAISSKKVIEPTQYIKPYQIQQPIQPGQSQCVINQKEKEIERLNGIDRKQEEFNAHLFSSAKIQKAHKNI